MTEKEQIFASSIKYTGVFPLSDLYNFCYQWLVEEESYDVSEDKYVEKITGETKTVEIEWTCEKKVTDYFKNQIKVKFKITNMKKIEYNDAQGKKVKANDGIVQVSVKGILLRDYQGKFEKTSMQKFLRSVYEKWIITSRTEWMQNELSKICDDFLTQVKAYLDLEARK